MSTKAFGATLNYLPAAKTGNGGPGLLGLLKTIVQAFEEGRAAQIDYQRLLARGMSQEQAAREVMLRG